MYLAILAALAGSASAAIKPFNGRQALERISPRSSQPGMGKPAVFDQLIDHANPSLGTFKQRYWWNADHYAGPHSPISLESPSEAAVYTGDDGTLDYRSNATLPGLLAQDNQGAYIVIEHRYFGNSTPVPAGQQLNSENAQYLTLDNAIQDLIYFAHNVVFPFDKTNGTATKPDKAPWLLSGCSYSGALSAWTQALAPGTFWAQEAGSAVVEALEQFWNYYEPIKNAMPQNCTADFQRIIKHVDQVLDSGNQTANAALKTQLGFAGSSDKDFAGSISGWLSVQQGHQVVEKASELNYYCDFIENQQPTATVPLPGADGVGLEKALEGLAALFTYMNNESGSSGSPADSGPDPWSWMLCNEPFEWWQAWSRFDTTGFLSKYWSWKDDIQAICVDQFPPVNGFEYGLQKGRTYHTINKKTGGWRNVNTKRLFWVNGQFDPWRGATVSATDRPDGQLQSTATAPLSIIPGAGHCNDYVTANANTPEGKPTFDAMLASFRQWVAEFYQEHPGLE